MNDTHMQPWRLHAQFLDYAECALFFLYFISNNHHAALLICNLSSQMLPLFPAALLDFRKPLPALISVTRKSPGRNELHIQNAWNNKSEHFSDSIPWHYPSFSLAEPCSPLFKPSASSPSSHADQRFGKQLKVQCPQFLIHQFVIYDLNELIWSLSALSTVLTAAGQKSLQEHKYSVAKQ